jgi:hypothetical protein
MDTFASPPPPSSRNAPRMPGAWQWSSEDRGYLQVLAPAQFPLYPIAVADPRFHAHSLSARVELGEPAFVLWDAAGYRSWFLALVHRLGVWFTHDGAALQSLTDVDADGDGLLVGELARVVG